MLSQPNQLKMLRPSTKTRLVHHQINKGLSLLECSFKMAELLAIITSRKSPLFIWFWDSEEDVLHYAHSSLTTCRMKSRVASQIRVLTGELHQKVSTWKENAQLLAVKHSTDQMSSTKLVLVPTTLHLFLTKQHVLYARTSFATSRTCFIPSAITMLRAKDWMANLWTRKERQAVMDGSVTRMRVQMTKLNGSTFRWLPQLIEMSDVCLKT